MKMNAFANGRYGPTCVPTLGRFANMGSTTNGHSSSSATAPAEARISAPTPTPSTEAIMAYSAIAPTRPHSWGSERATAIDAATITAAYAPENTAATTALATSTSVRFGTAMNVVRISPLRYSLVTVSDDRIIRTGTPKTATPIAAFSGSSGPGPYTVEACIAASPRLSTATAIADHSGDLRVDSLMHSAFNTATTPIQVTARYCTA